MSWTRPSRPHTLDEAGIEKFWSYVDKSAGADGCWYAGAQRNPNQYGVFGYKGRTYNAHRLAYELTHGFVPTGFVMMHQCDNKPCCNPAHLRPGTASENSREAVARGLLPLPVVAEPISSAAAELLTRLLEADRVYEATVREVLSQGDEIVKGTRLHLGMTQRAFAEALGVDFTYISKIERGHSAVSRALLGKIARLLAGEPV